MGQVFLEVATSSSLVCCCRSPGYLSPVYGEVYGLSDGHATCWMMCSVSRPFPSSSRACPSGNCFGLFAPSLFPQVHSSSTYSSNQTIWYHRLNAGSV